MYRTYKDKILPTQSILLCTALGSLQCVIQNKREKYIYAAMHEMRCALCHGTTSKYSVKR